MNELLPGLDFSGYIQGRAEICNKIRRGFDEIEDAIKMAKDGKLFDRRLHEGKRYLSRTESELIDTIDRSAWRYLMEQSGLWSFLNDARRNEWTRGLGGYDPVPEFSSDNVEATFREYYESREQMRDDGLRDIFWNLVVIISAMSITISRKSALLSCLTGLVALINQVSMLSMIWQGSCAHLMESRSSIIESLH